MIQLIVSAQIKNKNNMINLIEIFNRKNTYGITIRLNN